MNQPEPEKEETLNTQLHIQHRREIGDIKKDVENIVSDMFGLRSDIKDVSMGLKYLTERLNEGVAKTGIKTWEKVNEISKNIIEIKHSDEKQDIRIEQTEKKTDKLMAVIFTLFVLMLGSVVGLSLWVIKNAGA